MKTQTCDCGRYVSYTSGGGGHTPCLGCQHCGTQPGGEPVVPHEFVAHEVETNTGPAELDRCRWCCRTRAQVEQLKGEVEP